MKKVCVWNEEREQKGGSTCVAWPNEVPRFWYGMSPEYVYVKVPLHVTVPTGRYNFDQRASPIRLRCVAKPEATLSRASPKLASYR